jgi:hypothetical protein
LRKDWLDGNSRRRLEIRCAFGNNFADWSFTLCKGLDKAPGKILVLNKSFTLGKNRFVRLIVLDRFSC